MSLSSPSTLRRTLNSNSKIGLSNIIFAIRYQGTVVRTINLADSKSISKPQQVQKLVSADVPVSLCPHQDSYRPGRIVPVRICRRADLERACQTKFCACPQKPPPKTTKNILCEMAVFGTKCAVTAGLIYWTVAEGFWGKPQDTEELYTRIQETITSGRYLNEVSLPRLEYSKFKIVDSYNKTIVMIMGLLVGIPMKISKQIREWLHPCEPVDEDPKKKKK